MDLFPIELWEQIIKNLDTRDWLALFTTCHILSAIAHSNLYQKVKIKRIIGNDLTETSSNSRIEQFSRTLAAKSDAAGLIQILKLYSTAVYYLPNRNAIQDRYTSHPILPQLASFTRLRKLKLSGYHIDIDCYTAIHSLPHLKILVLECCTTDAALADILLSETWGNTLSQLSIKSPQSSEGWHAFAPRNLPSLIIKNINFEDRSLGGSIFSKFSPNGINKSLTKFCWTHPYIPVEMIRFLENSPEIREFSLGYPHRLDYSKHINDLSSTALQKLVKFSAPEEYISIFIQGRPVRSVAMILGRSTSLDILTSLGRSSVPVSSLELHRSGEDAILAESILHSVPTTLHRLVSHDIVRKGWLPSWLRIISATPSLRELEFGDCPESFRRDFVHAFSKACASLKRVTYGPGETWVLRNDGDWERYFRV